MAVLHPVLSALQSHSLVELMIGLRNYPQVPDCQSQDVKMGSVLVFLSVAFWKGHCSEGSFKEASLSKEC